MAYLESLSPFDVQEYVDYGYEYDGAALSPPPPSSPLLRRPQYGTVEQTNEEGLLDEMLLASLLLGYGGAATLGRGDDVDGVFIGTVGDAGRGDGDDDDNEFSAQQKEYADYLSDALGQVDEAHLRSNGQILFSKERALDVTLMDGTQAPDRIAEASITVSPVPEDETVVVMGEIALLAREVYAAERALVDQGVVVTAIHNHWFSEPTLYYLHFQTTSDDPAELFRRIAPWWSTL